MFAQTHFEPLASTKANTFCNTLNLGCLIVACFVGGKKVSLRKEQAKFAVALNEECKFSIPVSSCSWRLAKRESRFNLTKTQFAPINFDFRSGKLKAKPHSKQLSLARKRRLKSVLSGARLFLASNVGESRERLTRRNLPNVRAKQEAATKALRACKVNEAANARSELASRFLRARRLIFKSLFFSLFGNISRFFYSKRSKRSANLNKGLLLLPLASRKTAPTKMRLAIRKLKRV